MPSPSDGLAQLQETIRTVVVEAHKVGVAASGSNDHDDPAALFQRAAELEASSDALPDSMQRAAQDILRELGNHQDSNRNGDEMETAASMVQQQKLSPLHLQTQTEQLQIKLQVLEKCSTARSLLDQSISLLEASSSSSSSTSTPRISNHDDPTTDASTLQEASRLYLEACSAVTKGEAILDEYQESSLETAEDSPVLAPVQALLRSQQSCLGRQQKDLISTAQSLWKQQVTFTATSIRCRSCVSISTILQTLQDLEAGDDLVSELVQHTIRDQLHQHALQPLLDLFRSDGKTPISRTDVSSHQVAKEHDERYLEWTTTATSATTSVLPAWKSTLEFLNGFFVFFAEHVLMEKEELLTVAGASLFGTDEDTDGASLRRLDLDKMGLESNLLRDDNKHGGVFLGPLLEALERSCIPDHQPVDGVVELQRIADELEPMINTFVTSMMTVFHVDTAMLTKGLTSFPASIEAKYAANRRTFHLQEARRILLEMDYHNTVRAGEQQNEHDIPLLSLKGTPAFPLQQMGISTTAFQLHAYARSIMDEAVQLSESDNSNAVVACLYQTARQALDLFRALIPVVRGREVATIPQVAAILYNDGIYLANGCMTIGLEYKEKLSSGAISADLKKAASEPPASKLRPQTCMMVDMAPHFLRMAELSLNNMIRVQTQQIKALVMERISLLGQALRSNEPLAEWSDAETAVDAGIYHLQHLHHAWQPVMSLSVLSQSLGRLADTMLSSFLEPILQATDISAEATQFVHRLFLHRTLRNLAPLLSPQHSSMWAKCEAVARFMDMTLVDVHAGLTQHRTLQSLQASEVIRLLEACFDDSAQRRKLLQLLARQ